MSENNFEFFSGGTTGATYNRQGVRMNDKMGEAHSGSDRTNVILGIVIFFGLVFLAMHVTTFVLLERKNRETSISLPKLDALHGGKLSFTEQEAEKIKPMEILVNKTFFSQLSKWRRAILNNIMSMEGWKVESNNYMYKVFTEHDDFDGAKDSCKRIGAQLASVGMRDPFIRHSVYVSLIKPLSADVWIGLHDREQEAEWVWLDGVESNRNNTFWQSKEPNNMGGNEDCGQFFTEFGEEFNDTPCSRYLYYLCEKPLENY